MVLTRSDCVMLEELDGKNGEREQCLTSGNIPNKLWGSDPSETKNIFSNTVIKLLMMPSQQYHHHLNLSEMS